MLTSSLIEQNAENRRSEKVHHSTTQPMIAIETIHSKIDPKSYEMLV